MSLGAPPARLAAIAPQRRPRPSVATRRRDEYVLCVIKDHACPVPDVVPTLVSAFRRSRFVIAGAAVLVATTPAAAQTDYYNTDAGRPLQIEDAYAVERRAFEIQVAPLRLERSRDGVYNWGVEPELAFGVLPRTQIEIGFPFAFIDAGA